MDISALTTVYADAAKQLTDSTKAQQLKNNLQGKSATDDELMDVCKQFESYFLEQVYKAMWKTVPQSEVSSQSTQTLMDFQKDQMIQAMAEQSTEQNGLGLAQTLYEQMKNNVSLP
jgi:flagellar protein FlgJ